MPLKTGEQAPAFQLPSTDRTVFSLAENRQFPLVLFFYPKNFTRTCTKEVCGFRDEFREFLELNIQLLLLGVSTDSLESHDEFRKEYRLPFHLLADTSGEVSALYKAKIPVVNISYRVTYLIDKDLIIRSVHSGMFEHREHVMEMLSKAKSLGIKN
jgi:thioredoxin-dependent peroxiredoxin